MGHEIDYIIYGKMNKQVFSLVNRLNNFLSGSPDSNIDVTTLDDLEKNKILISGNDRYAPGERLILYKSERFDLKKYIHKACQLYAEFVHANISSIETSFHKSEVYQNQGFEWVELFPAVLAAHLLDFEIRTSLLEKGYIDDEELGFYIWGIPKSLRGRNSFGINMLFHQELGFGLGELWHCDLPKLNIRLSQNDLTFLWEIISKKMDYTSVDDNLHSLMVFQYYKIVSLSMEGYYKCNIPIFEYSNQDPLHYTIKQLSNQIVEEIIIPFFQKIVCDPENDIKYDNKKVFLHGIDRILMENTMDLLEHKGFISSYQSLKDLKRIWIWKSPNEELKKALKGIV